jgi:hypothetical protein
MYPRNLGPSETSDYILWKASKKLNQSQQTSPIMKQDGYWARTQREESKHLRNTFAEHLVLVLCRDIICNQLQITKVGLYEKL